MYPEDESVLRSGRFEDASYDIIGVVEVSGEPSPSPHSVAFDAYHIPRIQATEDDMAANPNLRYVSDGDPMVVSVPPIPSPRGSTRSGPTVSRRA
jgi:hypothetical protein